VPLSALVLALLVLYRPMFSSWAVYDDAGNVRFGLVDPLAGSIREACAGNIFFRPLERLVNLVDVQWLGYRSLLVSHSVSFVAFVACILAVYRLTRFVEPGSVAAAYLAAALLGGASVSTMSVIEIDTVSQQFATLFSLAFLILLLSPRPTTPRLVLAFACALLALLSKESSPGLVAGIPVAAAGLRLGRVPTAPAAERRRVLFGCGAVVVAFALYALLRVGVAHVAFFHAGEARYQFQVSIWRCLKNFAMFSGGMLYAGSTLDLFPSVVPWRVVVSLGLSLGLYVVCALGWYDLLVRRGGAGSFTLRSASALVFLWCCGTFPAILTDHVSEHYVYGSLPYYAVLVGVGFAAGVRRTSVAVNLRFASGMCATLLAAMFTWHAFGVREKIGITERLGRVTLSYVDETAGFFRALRSTNVRMCWRGRDDVAEVPSYGTLFLSNRNLFDPYAWKLAASLTGKVATLEPLDAGADDCSVRVGFDGNRLHLERIEPLS
jgi:hypothetical protein